MKNLLLITQWFPFGNAEVGFLQSEFQELIKHFHVTILARDNDQPLNYPLPAHVTCGKYVTRSKIRIFPYVLFQLSDKETRSEIKAVCKEQSIHKKVKRLLKVLSYGARANEVKRQIERVVIEQNIDLIYTYWCNPATVAALRLKERYPRLHVITRFHGGDLFQDRTILGWQILRSYIAEQCDKLFFVCEDGKRYFTDCWGHEEKAVVSYIGTKKRKRVPIKDKDVLVLVSCSYLIPSKRVNLILEALQFIPAEQKVEWHHYGNGELEDQLKKEAVKAQEKYKNHHIFFHGEVQNHQIEEEYHLIGAQLFITTTASEGLPVSMMEAISMGIPAIGTRVNGIPELIDDTQSGFLLPCNLTPQQVANAIMRYARLSFCEKKKMSDAAFACWSEKFDAEKNAVEFCKVLEKM